jgi:hypothetical protein
MHKYGCVRVFMTPFMCVRARVCVSKHLFKTHAICYANTHTQHGNRSYYTIQIHVCMYTTHTPPPTNKVQSQDQSGDNTSIHREAKHLQLTKD